jgi:hypothetical protein
MEHSVYNAAIRSARTLIDWALLSLILMALPQTRAQTAPDNAAPGITLAYVPHSSAKLEQLLGETDKELHRTTLSRTQTRYGIAGTDLGNSFEHRGRIYFLFGDTVGTQDHALDTIATTDALEPEAGVRLDFLTGRSGQYLTIQPPGISMGAFEVPVAGISLEDRIYVAVSTNHADDRSTDRSVLTRFTLPSTFEALRTISQLPSGRFVKMSMHKETQALAGMPPGGPYIVVWGTGVYRHSDAYLSVVPVANFETGEATRYFGGLDATATPSWSASESDARPVVQNGTMGDLSVTWCKDLNIWLMTFDSRAPAPRGIEFSYSGTPWGPWSKPQVIFNATRDGAIGRFIHDPDATPDDGVAGPVIGKGRADPSSVRGGAYAPYVIERWTRLQGSELSLYYTLSTWNPYVVVLMKSRFKVDGLVSK